MNQRRVRQLVGATLVSLVVPLAACATETTAVAPTAQEQEQLFNDQCEDTVIPDLPALEPEDADDSGTTPVDSEFGPVDLPSAPQSALGMYTTDVDILVWLGIPLADSQPIRGDSGYETFPCFFPFDPLQGVSTFANYPDYDYESILLADPDLILNGLGYDKKVVRRLPDIAPTYSVNAYDGRSWMEHFEETAIALGREDRYQMWKDVYDERLAEVAAAIGDQDVVVAPVSFWEGEVWTGCYSGVECQVFEDLGLTIDPLSLANDREGVSLSGEQVGRLQGLDVAFSTVGLGDAGRKEFDTVMDEMEGNALFAELPFVTDDRISTYEMEMTYGSPSGQLAFLDVVEQTLAPQESS